VAETKPWFIGEFGSDGVNKGEDRQNRSGWRDRNKLTATSTSGRSRSTDTATQRTA